MRTKKALYNIIAQISYEIVATICALILPRLILGTYGSAYNGLISSVTQFLGYISVLTLGVSGATRVALYKAKAKNDIQYESAILKATERYMRKVAFAFVGYLIILAFIYPLLVKEEFAWLEVSSLVIIIGLGTLSEFFFGVTYKTYLMASQSLYIYNIIQIFMKIGNALITILLVRLGYTIQIVKLGSAIVFVASPIVLNHIVRKKYGIVKNVEPDYSALSQRKNVMAHSIANIIHQYTDIFVLTIFTNVKLVSVYSIYTLAFDSLRKLQDVFTTGLEAAFGELWAHGEKEKFIKNFLHFEFLMFAFVSVVFSCTAVLILPFVRIYTKGIHDTNYIIPSFAFLSVASYAMYCLRDPYLIAVQAAGKYKETRIHAFIEAGLNFGISVLAVLKYGIIGVTVGTIIANSYRTIQYALFLNKSIIIRKNSALLKHICWIALNFVLFFAAVRLIPWVDIDTWGTWILSGVFYFAVSCTITGLTSLVFFRTHLVESLSLAKRMLSRKHK